MVKDVSGRNMIKIENLCIDLGEFHLRNVELEIREGEYMVLLGPTGAGKTVVIECLAGLYEPSEGTMTVGPLVVNGLYPEERNVGYVPQDYALFPNMTVRQNIAYGLEARGVSLKNVEDKVNRMMDMLSIGHLHHRYPLNLSGGEKQRAALGRALVTEPQILLLDEPLSALDENLRSELAAELREIQEKSGATFLHICHSFEEAADLADRVAIMDNGRIVQVGTIDEIVSNPVSRFVARFSRMRNFMEGEIREGKVWLTDTLCCEYPLSDEKFDSSKSIVIMGIRPDDILVEECPLSEKNHTQGSGGSFCVEGRLKSVRSKLSHCELMFETKASIPWNPVVTVGKNSAPRKIGEVYRLVIPQNKLHFFEDS